MFLILTLIILVAAFNIISGLIMLVKDKGRDIAILRTMGATRGTILRIFFMAGASVGVVGTLARLRARRAVLPPTSRSIRQCAGGPDRHDAVRPDDLFPRRACRRRSSRPRSSSVALMALGLSFLATIYPSWRAARLDPVEALRYE